MPTCAQGVEWGHIDMAGPVWDDKQGGATGWVPSPRALPSVALIGGARSATAQRGRLATLQTMAGLQWTYEASASEILKFRLKSALNSG